MRVVAEWRPKNCGLTNLGNSCYMNSVLQCLLHTTELSHFFLRGFYRTDLVAGEGRLAEAFYRLVNQTHSHTVASGQEVIPADFKTAIGVFNPQFVDFEQKDSQELLSAVLLGIHQGLNKGNGVEPRVIYGDGSADGALADTVWASYKRAHNSCIKDTFRGLFRNRVTCSQCGRTSVKFEPFDILQVHFRHEGAASLADMLHAEFAEEQMAGPTAYTRLVQQHTWACCAHDSIFNSFLQLPKRWLQREGSCSQQANEHLALARHPRCASGASPSWQSHRHSRPCASRRV
jgi:ubiquitin C-terminal hydrolase